MCLRSELRDEVKSLRDHETTRSGLLDRMADRIEPNHLYPSRLKAFEDSFQIGLPLRMFHIDVNLLRGKCCPQKAVFTAFQRHVGKRQPGTWTIDAQQFLLARTRRK